MKVVSVLLAFLFPTIVSGLLEDYIFSEDGLTAVNQDLAGVSNEIATLSALTPVIGRLRTAKCKYQITYNLYIKSSDIVGEQTAYKNRIPDTANTLNGQDVNRFGGYVIAGVPVYQGASPGSQVGTLSETIFLVNPFAFPTSPPVLKCVTDGSVSFAGVSGTADRVSFQGSCDFPTSAAQPITGGAGRFLGATGALAFAGPLTDQLPADVNLPFTMTICQQ